MHIPLNPNPSPRQTICVAPPSSPPPSASPNQSLNAPLSSKTCGHTEGNQHLWFGLHIRARLWWLLPWLSRAHHQCRHAEQSQSEDVRCNMRT